MSWPTSTIQANAFFRDCYFTYRKADMTTQKISNTLSTSANSALKPQTQSPKIILVWDGHYGFNRLLNTVSTNLLRLNYNTFFDITLMHY